MLGPEDLTGLDIPDLDLRVRPAHGQLGPVGAERQAPDTVLRTVKGEPPLPGLAIPQLDIRPAPASRERAARAGGDPAAIGAEGDRDHVSGGYLHGQALGVAEPVDVVPLPAAALDRAAVEQVLGQGDVVVLDLAIGPVDPVDVVFPGQVLGVAPVGDRQRPVDLDVRPGPQAQERRQEQEDRHDERRDRRPPPRPLDGPLPGRDRPRHDRLAVEEPPQVLGQRRGRVVALLRLLLQALQAIVSRSRGRPGTSRDGGTGSVVLTCSSVSRTVAPRNGGRPVSSS